DEEFRGLYVSDEDVDALLEGTANPAALLSPPPHGDGAAAIERAVEALTLRIAESDTPADADSAPRLVHLCRLFGLSPFQRDVVVVCLAAELDLKYERLYAYLQDDVTKKRPTVDLVVRLFCTTLEERVAARRCFLPDAPLVSWSLVSLNDDPGARRPVLLAR